jgi:hypothetical protein
VPGPVLHLGAVMTCSHAGPATPTAPFPRVALSGQPAVTVSSPWAVTGCALTGTGAPPCATGQHLVGSTRVLAGGVPLALLTGSTICVPTGTPMLPVTAQPRVVAT